MKHLVVGIVLCVLYFGWLFKLMKGMRKEAQLVDKSSIGQIDIKSDAGSFELLKDLHKKKDIYIKLHDVAAYFQFFGGMLDHKSSFIQFIGGCWSFFELGKLLTTYILIPVSFFFAYSYWPLVLFFVLAFFFGLKLVFKISALLLSREILKDKDRFDSMYKNCGLEICRSDAGNAVAFPTQWAEAVKTWASWRKELLKTVAEDLAADSESSILR